MKKTDYGSTIPFHPLNPHPSFFSSSTIIFHPVNPHRSFFFSSTTIFDPINSNVSIYFSSTKLFNQSTHIRTGFSSTIIFHPVNPQLSIYFASTFFIQDKFSSIQPTHPPTHIHASVYFSSSQPPIMLVFISQSTIFFSSSQLPISEYLFLIHLK
jgi:hypothetical protein